MTERMQGRAIPPVLRIIFTSFLMTANGSIYTARAAGISMLAVFERHRDPKEMRKRRIQQKLS